jgi:glycosyltransferase involved in cell wall biosynthesis
MRTLIIPVISSRHLASAPSLNFIRSFIEQALVYDPQAVFYVVLPTQTPEWQYEGFDAFQNTPRTHVIYTAMYRNQFDDLVLITRDLWDKINERFGSHYFDVILNEKPSLAPMLKKLSSFHVKSKSRVVPIVNRDQMIIQEKWFKTGQHEELLETFGWLTAPTIFQSDHQAQEAYSVARKYLKPIHVERLMNQSIVFPLGIDCDDVDRHNGNVEHEPTDEIIINYSHKLFMEQKFIDSLKIMDSVFAGGRKVKLQIVTGSSEMKMKMIKDAKPFRYMEIHGRSKRETFLQLAKRAHVFISNSYYEDFSATVVEQLYSGLIPVLLDKPWSRYLLPEGYPFLFKDPAEGNAMLRYVVDNYDDVAMQWRGKIVSKVRQEFDLKAVAVSMYQRLEQEWRQAKGDMRTSAGIEQLVDAVYEDLPPEFSIDDICKMVKKHSKHLDIEKDAESMSTPKWYFVDLMMLRHGDKLEDTGSEIITWRKI